MIVQMALSTLSSENTDPRSYIDVACLGRLLTHLHIRGQCCIVETTLVFGDAASPETGVYGACWDAGASAAGPGRPRARSLRKVHRN